MLFDNSPIGRIDSSPVWTSELLPWEEKNKFTQRKMQKNDGYDFLRGKGIVRGQLIGGCIEVLETAKGTEIWPSADCWNNAIIFLKLQRKNLVHGILNTGFAITEPREYCRRLRQ